MRQKRYIQIDILKGIGILMVLINHSNNYVYSSDLFFKLSRSCVQILVFCAGINAFIKLSTIFSTEREEDITHILWVKFWKPKILSIFIPYIVFTAGFLFLWKKELDLYTLWQYIIGFNISNPVYFVPLYIQLILVAPVIYYLVCRCRTGLLRCMLAIFAFPVCLGFLKFTYMLPIYGAGQYFMGGTYGWVFIIGMLFGAKLCNYEQKKAGTNIFEIFPALGLVLVWISSLKMAPDMHMKLEQIFGGGNPPGLDSMAEGFLLIWLIWILVSYLQTSVAKFSKRWSNPLVLCGKYSLYIFLWHMFIKAAMNQVIAIAELPGQSILYGIPSIWEVLLV